MQIIVDFEDEFNTLVTRGQIQIIGLRDIVNSIKKYTEHTQSEAFKSAIHQIEEKIAPILGMFFSMPSPESFEFTQLYCFQLPFQLRETFRWKTVEWEYGTENGVPTQSKEMCNYAQILADLYGTKVRLLHIAGKSTNGEFKTDEKSCNLLGVYNPTNLVKT
jgi:hypothetical protein